jgi:hypothetical protein
MTSNKCGTVYEKSWNSNQNFLNMDPDAPKINADPKSQYGTVRYKEISVVDPDPHGTQDPHASAFILAGWIRIRIDKKCWIRTALKPTNTLPPSPHTQTHHTHTNTPDYCLLTMK